MVKCHEDTMEHRCYQDLVWKWQLSVHLEDHVHEWGLNLALTTGSGCVGFLPDQRHVWHATHSQFWFCTVILREKEASSCFGALPKSVLRISGGEEWCISHLCTLLHLDLWPVGFFSNPWLYLQLVRNITSFHALNASLHPIKTLANHQKFTF